MYKGVNVSNIFVQLATITNTIFSTCPNAYKTYRDYVWQAILLRNVDI